MVDDFIAWRNIERGWIGSREREFSQPQGLIAIARVVTLDLQVDAELGEYQYSTVRRIVLVLPMVCEKNQKVSRECWTSWSSKVSVPRFSRVR